MLVGVDIGGTFTDFVISHDGQLRIHKQSSTPHNPAQAMLAGLNALLPDANTLTQVAHGSTVATNAILERKGAKTALLMTQGFRDVLFIGRQTRPDLYALQPQLPSPLIPRDLCFDIPERLAANGDVLLPLDIAALDTVLDTLATQQIESIAVCFLYSFINPEHEQQVRDRIVARGLLEAWQVALSSDVLPEFREYERASTVALEAYVRPVMVRYVQQLRDELPAKTPLRIMKSDGGVMTAARVHTQAVHTALSGPAAGVIGAFHVAQRAGYDHIITLDMGGTSTDVALCPGEPQLSPHSTIDGLPLRARLLDIETIGAGGGSIARVDAGGALRVGPESAGAQPGPVIYGRGGQQVTVSDANAILGRLDANRFLGGQMALDIATAEQVMDTFAQDLHMTRIEAARGIIDIANTNIDRALRRVSVARGYDPRDFTLVAFGGAGPLHACEVAERLHIQRVLIPRFPGVLCAFGLLVADIMLEYSQSVLAIATRNLIARLRAYQGELLATGRSDLQQEGIPEEAMRFTVYLDMRYQGQAHELTLEFKGDVIEIFHNLHEQTYGHALRDRPVEIVNIRLQAVGDIAKPELQPEPLTYPTAPILEERESVLGGEMALYKRNQLRPGAVVTGEALIFQMDSTVYVPRQWHAAVDAYHNLIMEWDGDTA